MISVPNNNKMPTVMVDVCKPSTWEVKAGGSCVQGQLGLYSETQLQKIKIHYQLVSQMNGEVSSLAPDWWLSA